MTRYTFYLLSLALLLASCSLQYADLLAVKYKGRYAKFLEPGETELLGYYHYVQSRTSAGEYVLRTFFPETKVLTSYEVYTSDQFTTRSGTAKEWYDDGRPKSEGQYTNDKPTGTWKFYSFDKEQLLSTGNYTAGERTGSWKTYFPNGVLKKEVNYQNGQREGAFTRYDSLSEVVNEGIYRADTIFQSLTREEKQVDAMPRFVACEDTQPVHPQYDCATRELLQFIYKNIKYPAIARDNYVEGTVMMVVEVWPNGSVGNIRVRKGICQSMADECRRIVKMMPKWEEPGIVEGMPVRTEFRLPIMFKLE